MATVYIVFEGEYEGVCVAGVFFDKALADRFADAGDGWVQEYEVSTSLIQEVESGLSRYRVSTNLRRERPNHLHCWKSSFTDEHEQSNLDEIESPDWNVYVHAWARSEEEAIEKVYEKLEPYIAKFEKE